MCWEQKTRRWLACCAAQVAQYRGGQVLPAGLECSMMRVECGSMPNTGPVTSGTMESTATGSWVTVCHMGCTMSGDPTYRPQCKPFTEATGRGWNIERMKKINSPDIKKTRYKKTKQKRKEKRKTNRKLNQNVLIAQKIASVFLMVYTLMWMP